MVRGMDSSTAAGQPMGALLLSFSNVQWKLKVYKGSVFYNKVISFACTGGSVCLCSPLLHLGRGVSRPCSAWAQGPWRRHLVMQNPPLMQNPPSMACVSGDSRRARGHLRGG